MEDTLAGSRAPFWWARWVPLALLAACAVALTLAVGGPVLIPLLLSFALAFMLEPVADGLQARGLTRNASVLLTLAGATLGALVLLLVLLPNAWHQLEPLAERLPQAVSAAGAQAKHLLDVLHERLSPAVYERLQASVTSLRDDPSAVTSRVGEWLSRGLFGLLDLGTAALGLLIVPFFVYYLLLDMNNIRRALEEHIPERHRGVGARLFDEVGDVVRGYVRGRFLVAVGMAIVYSVGLLALGVPLWAAIGLVAGFVGIIPYLGVTTGLILALAFAALDGAGALRLGGVVGVFALAQLLEDYVLTPRLIGDRLELHPMLVFIALIIAGDMVGLLGLVLAIPVLGVLKVLSRFFDELYLRSDFYRMGAADPGASPIQVAAAATVSASEIHEDAARFEETRESLPQPVPDAGLPLESGRADTPAVVTADESTDPKGAERG